MGGKSPAAEAHFVRPHHIQVMPDAMSGEPINAGIASGKSFEERVGSPDAVTSALGLLVLAFAWLEEVLSLSVMRVLSNEEMAGRAVVAELAFGKKLHLLASLVRLNPCGRHFNSRAPDPLSELEALITDCFRAEELRNRALHSMWLSVPLEPDSMQRFKISAKAKRGIQTDTEILDSAAILDVVDFMDRTADSLEMFFAPPERLA